MSREENSTNVRFSQRALTAGLRLLERIDPALAGAALARLFITVPRHRTPDRERAWLADARRESRSAGGRRLAMQIWEAERPTALLVHGWAGRGSQLGAFVEPLRRRGYRVVAFDGPGHGESEGRRSSLPELSRSVEALLRSERPALVIAHSVGAAAATLAFARCGQGVPAIYLAPADDAGDFLHRLAGLLGLPAEIGAIAQRRLEARFRVRWEWLVASRVAPWFDSPLLVFHDARDREVPREHGERLVAAWPEARLETTHGLGHRRILRDPDVVRRAVDFAVEHAGRARPTELRAAM